MARFFIDRPIFAWVIAILIMMAGTLALYTLPIAQYPRIAPPEISVTSIYPGASAKTIEDSVTVIEPILPWTAAGAYMAGTLGVATLAYMPWAVSNWIAIFFALLWAATGIGIAKLTPQEQAEMEKDG